jgi:hypothetical protein
MEWNEAEWPVVEWIYIPYVLDDETKKRHIRGMKGMCCDSP